MKNRSIILTAILSLLGCGGLSCTALAQSQSAVQVTNTPNVKVVNTTPIPVTGTVATTAVEPARNAVQQPIGVGLPSGVLSGASSFTIPAGKIFVLETVSFNASGTEPRITLTVVDPIITGGTDQLTYDLVIPPPNSLGETHGSQALRLYAQPGFDVILGFSVTSSSGPSILSVSLSGYFVNAQ